MESGSSQCRVGGRETIVTVLKKDCLSVMIFPSKTAKQCSRLPIGLCISQSGRISRPEGMKPWTDISNLPADPALSREPDQSTEVSCWTLHPPASHRDRRGAQSIPGCELLREDRLIQTDRGPGIEFNTLPFTFKKLEPPLISRYPYLGLLSLCGSALNYSLLSTVPEFTVPSAETLQHPDNNDHSGGEVRVPGPPLSPAAQTGPP